MPKKLPPQDVRTARVLTVLRSGEREQLQRRADAAGLTLSSAVRRAVLRDLKKPVNSKA
jgi:hypothetical protein